MKATVIIATFNRAHLLEHGLRSMSNLGFEVEIVVVNDGDVKDDTERVCGKFKNLNIKYLPINKKHGWRVPGFAFNYGVKRTDSDVLFISCAEIYHLDNTVEEMLKAFESNTKILTIPNGKDDKQGNVLKRLDAGHVPTNTEFNSMKKLGVILPFFMGMNRKDFEDIGGYDEDFTGFGYDDNDIVDRMKAVGNKYHPVKARVIHLWHKRLGYSLDKKQYMHNHVLYEKRKGTIVRNEGRKWGNG